MSENLSEQRTDPGSTTGLWRVVAAREIAVRARSKAFIWGTVVTMVAVALAILGGFYLADRDKVSSIGVIDGESTTLVEAASKYAHSTDDRVSFDAEDFADADAAEQAVRDGDIDAALLPGDDGYQLVGDTEVSPRIEEAVRATVSQQAVAENASAQQVDLDSLYAGTDVTERLISPDADDQGLRQAMAFGFVLIFYLSAMIFGLQMATSVTQEKESRVVEILASAVPLRSLLWGKVIGHCVLAIGQVTLVVATGAVSLLLAGQGEALSTVGPAMLWYLLFFILGFVTLSSFWAMAGSMASRQQDLQASTMPVQLLLLVPYMIWFVGSDKVIEIASMLPVVATLLMPPRLAVGEVPLWQLLVAVAATLLAAILLIRLAAQVYQRSLLRTDSLSFKELVRR